MRGMMTGSALTEKGKPMDDVISRDEALSAIRMLYPSMPIVNVFNAFEKWKDKYKTYLECEDVIKSVPSAQKKGHWLYPTDIKGFCRCEHCGALWGRDLYENRFFKYCPRCGADMRGDEDR